MSDTLQSALLIELAGTLHWSAALPPLDRFTGTLTAIDPGQPLDISQYARRDREFQHRDMINAAAVAKVSIYARTVWNGTVVQPVLQGVTEVTDSSGTNVTMPLDPSQVGDTLPNTSTAVQYVLNADIPYATVQVTDVDLYNRDLMLFETLARAAAIFPTNPPIRQVDQSSVYVGATSVWATAEGTDRPKVPNAAEPMSRDTFKDPDLYLAERDNQIAGYVAQVAQALQNPFEYATRIYVKIDAPNGADSSESETYVLTNNVFIVGNTYTAGVEVIHDGSWYRANNTTTDTPPSSDWTLITSPTQFQFIADPSLDSRNRIVYDSGAKTLQWFRERLDLIHVPQIVGFYVPGILPGQAIQTVAAVPEQKDAEFYRQKAARVEFTTGTLASQQVFSPTGNRNPSSTYVTGGLNTLFQDSKRVTLPVPDVFTLNFVDIICTAGTYALDCLVRPSPMIEIAGGDNDQGSVDAADGGTTYSAIGDTRNWEVALPAGGWKLFIEFSNFSSAVSSSFGIKATQGATPILANTLPLYYTDENGDPLAEFTVASSPGIDIQSDGQTYNFSVQWTSGNGQLHIKKLRFAQVDGPDTSHYIMQAAWLNSISENPDEVVVAGGDAEGVTPTLDGGVDFTTFNTPIKWIIDLTEGNWQMYIAYSNVSAAPTTQFGISVNQPGFSNQPLVLSYTDGTNVALPTNTIVTSAPIGIQSIGNSFPLEISWTSSSGSGQFHIRDLTFILNSSVNSLSNLDVIGQGNMPDVMPFRFYLSGTSTAPQISVTWLPKSASIWQSKAYNPGDQVLYNLVYWQASAITTATDIPGQSSVWFQLGLEPQIPLVFEQIQLLKHVETIPTPEVVGFQGFRQDMLERALRADEDAYSKALSQVGTNFPEFRDSLDAWTFSSTGSWMSFMEVYAPRLRQARNIASGGIVPGRQYEAVTQTGESVTYNSVSYSDGERFYGVSGVTTFSRVGQPIVNQVGAYTLSKPSDIGKTGLVPAGIEYVQNAGTGTVHGWYPSYASYPTHQAVQPWMIEQGFYVADDDFNSPDGNPVSPGAPDNPPTPHLTIILVPETSSFAIPYPSGGVINGLIFVVAGDTFYSSVDGVDWTELGDTDGSFTPLDIAFGSGLYVAVGTGGGVATSPDCVTWTTRTSASANDMYSVIYDGGKFVAVGAAGDSMSSANGITWANNPTGGSENFVDMVYATGLFVAVGDAGQLYTSPNGTSWTVQASNTAENLRGVTYGAGKFVVTGANNTALTSTDAVTWTVNAIAPNDPLGIAFGNNLFILGTGDTEIYTSTDGINWDSASTCLGIPFFLMHYSGATFVVLESSPPT